MKTIPEGRNRRSSSLEASCSRIRMEWSSYSQSLMPLSGKYPYISIYDASMRLVAFEA
jgi:hypothetical protein